MGVWIDWSSGLFGVGGEGSEGSGCRVSEVVWGQVWVVGGCLEGVQVVVRALLGQKFLVCAGFRYSAVVQDVDAVCALDVG